MNMSLMTEDGILRSASEIASILGKNRLHKLGFNIPRGKVATRQAVMLNKAEEEIPSMSGLAKADDIELQEFENYKEYSEKHGETHQVTRGRIL